MKSMRALIVDDSRAYRMVLQRYLKQLGFQTLEAESGEEALLILKQQPDIQVITIDQKMPQMSGTRFVSLVRKSPEFAKIPILMISVEDQIESQQEALSVGVNEYLVKPVTKQMIEEKLSLMDVAPPDAESAGPDAKP